MRTSRIANTALYLLLSLSACTPEPTLDILIIGGMVYDGTDQPARQVDIGIRADTIAFIGDASETEHVAARTVEAAGYSVTPGFIDPHTHAMKDLSDSVRHQNLNYLLQGVTTVVTGSDGGSDNFIGDRLTHWQNNGIGTNAAIMVGHRNIRQLVMGMREEAPTAEEMTNMKAMVRRGMEEGALGLSSGLYYSPASFSSTEEVIELAKVSAEFGGLYDAHIRDESTYNIGLLAAIKESIEIAEKANITANISHIKCLGIDVWGMSSAIIDTIEAARSRGLRITADQYPFRASGTHLGAALLPKWVFADIDDYTPRLVDSVLLPQIQAAVAENIRRRGGAESLLLVLSELPNLEGRTLAEVAEEWQLSDVEAAIKIIANGDAAIASFNMNEEDVFRFMRQDWVMTSSDGTTAHPRKFASFPKKIREYVLDKEVLPLADMVRKSTGLTAEVFGIPKRGKLQVGNYADVLVFKPEELRDNASYAEPALLSSGMWYIVLNGEVAVAKGEVQEGLFGRVVRR
ncbi:N-acyl-D-amino-acid deacylase family protein [Neolewinella persica]|uniref:N-acyl-D-amino-acid deacylase family protein n=1 Tax=Neolewinella persica TaxID=70998 RepID=UPI000477B0AB|nr:amidohydrolase family protein [Neolewinella persica]